MIVWQAILVPFFRNIIRYFLPLKVILSLGVSNRISSIINPISAQGYFRTKGIIGRESNIMWLIIPRTVGPSRINPRDLPLNPRVGIAHPTCEVTVVFFKEKLGTISIGST